MAATFGAAYDAVPEDEDNLGGTGYDQPDKVVRISPIERDGVDEAGRASVKAALHYTNDDAPITSFNRSTIVDFVQE